MVEMVRCTRSGGRGGDLRTAQPKAGSAVTASQGVGGLATRRIWCCRVRWSGGRPVPRHHPPTGPAKAGVDGQACSAYRGPDSKRAGPEGLPGAARLGYTASVLEMVIGRERKHLRRAPVPVADGSLRVSRQHHRVGNLAGRIVPYFASSHAMKVIRLLLPPRKRNQPASQPANFARLFSLGSLLAGMLAPSLHLKRCAMCFKVRGAFVARLESCRVRKWEKRRKSPRPPPQKKNPAQIQGEKRGTPLLNLYDAIT